MPPPLKSAISISVVRDESKKLKREQTPGTCGKKKFGADVFAWLLSSHLIQFRKIKNSNNDNNNNSKPDFITFKPSPQSFSPTTFAQADSLSGSDEPAAAC